MSSHARQAPAGVRARSAFAWSTSLGNTVGDGSIARDWRRAKTVDHTVDVRRGAVLTHLPLSLDPIDRHLDPDDRLELLLDVSGRCITRLPWAWAAGLMLCRERIEMRAKEGGIVMPAQRAARVYSDVAPREIAFLERPWRVHVAMRFEVGATVPMDGARRGGLGVRRPPRRPHSTTRDDLDHTRADAGDAVGRRARSYPRTGRAPSAGRRPRRTDRMSAAPPRCSAHRESIPSPVPHSCERVDAPRHGRGRRAWARRPGAAAERRCRCRDGGMTCRHTT